MKQISDVSVSIQTLKAVATNFFGVPAFFVPEKSMAYKEYSSLDALSDDAASFGDGFNALYAKAKAFMSQDANAGTFSVITYVPGTIADAYNAYSSKGYFWALMSTDLLSGTVDPSKNDAIALSSAIEGDDTARMMMVNTTPASALTATEYFTGNTKTVGLYGVQSADVADSSNALDAALIGKYGSAPVGSLNWHDLPNLSGINPINDNITAGQFSALDKANWVGYVTKVNGIAQTSSGRTLSGDYIDQIEGKAWMKSSIQMDLQNLLTNSGKISFDEHGAQLIAANVEATMNRGWKQGIIATDTTGQAGVFKVISTPIDSLSKADFEQRVYKGVEFDYTASNGIDQIGVHGIVTE